MHVLLIDYLEKENHMEQTNDQPGEFVIARLFDAPRDRVWKAWTDRDQLMQWFGPAGCAIAVAKLDLRPGGLFHYCMRMPGGQEMWGRFTYREIVPPERIVLVNSFSDPNAGITRHPYSPTWPRETLSTTILAEQGDKTMLTLRWQPLNPTAEERQTFDSSHDSMKMGWTGTFDQLAAHLAKSHGSRGTAP
jgi:uncharacterized protein YndB with AHSA1/START domain